MPANCLLILSPLKAIKVPLKALSDIRNSVNARQLFINSFSIKSHQRTIKGVIGYKELR